MLNTIVKFAKSEDGAVTVDWVILTAGVVGLGLATIALIGSRATDQSDSLGAFVADRNISQNF